MGVNRAGLGPFNPRAMLDYKQYYEIKLMNNEQPSVSQVICLDCARVCLPTHLFNRPEIHFYLLTLSSQQHSRIIVSRKQQF